MDMGLGLGVGVVGINGGQGRTAATVAAETTGRVPRANLVAYI